MSESLSNTVDRIIDDIWEDASCLTEGDTPHHPKEWYRRKFLATVVKAVEGMPRLKDAHKYLNPADAAYAERAAIVELLGGEGEA